MSRPYVRFKEKRIGNKIDYDWAYGYQCTDLIKQYLDECLWWGKVWALGNANQIPNNLIKKWFAKIDPNKSVMQWDIIVRTKWSLGHIAIVDRVIWNCVYVLEQNGSGKNSWSWTWDNAIRIKPYEKSRFQVILRNDDIVKNYNKELNYVNEKLDERETLLKDTIDYKNSIYYLNN